MVTKRDITPLGTPPDDGSFSSIQPGFEDCYASLMNSSFAALGRNIVLHLTPERTIDNSGIQTATQAVHYNPFTGRAPRGVPSTISTVRSPAVIHVHRDATYVAHIKHGPTKTDDQGGVELGDGDVLTTTVLASEKHIKEAESATIDGKRYTLDWYRPIGLQNTRYLMSKWNEINEVEGN